MDAGGSFRGMSMEAIIIGNPIAGSGKARNRILPLAELLKKRGHEVEIFWTHGPGDALSKARSLTGFQGPIIVAGGDGTFNEVLNGLENPSSVCLAQYPTGTANMLARELNLPYRTEDMVDMIERGNTTRLDMGLIGDTRFLMVAGAGFDAAVTRRIKLRRRETLGYLGYFWPIVRTLRRSSQQRLMVTVDGGEPVSGATVIALKVKNYGGYFVFAEEADLRSGRFEVCVFKSVGLSSLIRYSAAGFLNKKEWMRDVRRLSGRRIRIEAEEPVPVQVDGDYCGDTPVQVELAPGVVKALVP